MTALDDVRIYYDANTARFERFGDGGGTFHRAVWGAGVRSRDEAFRYVDELVWRELEPLVTGERTHVLDLGCGVGSSLIFLASRARARFTGATLSGVQAARARERSREFADHVEIVQASYLELPVSVPKAQFAFSIEAFIHGPDPEAYFRAASRYLDRSGILVVCDDFLTEAARRDTSERTLRLLDEVRTGWLANTLVTTDEADRLALRAGFRSLKNLDLTSHLEIGRPRDRMISVLVALGRYLPLKGEAWRSFVGGNALQQALRSGLLEYRFRVFRKDGGDDATG
jgi:cyclopropane fatty-acyl-phospholipid synthase-like methyltransferase